MDSCLDIKNIYTIRMDGFRSIFVRKTIPFDERLVAAVKTKNLDAVVSFFVENPDLGNMRDKAGVPLLYFAIQNRTHNIARALLDNKANPDEMGNYNTDDSFPLHLAIRLKDVEMTQILLDYGADVNKLTYSGTRTPLALAVETDNPRLVATLCRFGAVVDQLIDIPIPRSLRNSSFIALNLAKSKQVRTILETTQKLSLQSAGSYSKILKLWQGLLEEYNTVYIQSQKTGQCYSDSFQFILYYADGLNRFFIENAVKQDQLSEKQKKRLFIRNDLNVKKYMDKGNDLLELYMAYTGNRFLNMVKSKPMQLVGPAKTLKRRPSVMGRAILNTGIVCSSIINLYDLFQKGEQEYKLFNLDVDEKGNLREEASLMFWNGLLKKIPSQYGSGGVYTNETLPENQYPYVVGVQIVGFPSDYRDMVGHAVSVVKILGNWYLCDDNIGFAQKIELTIEELVHSTIGYNLEAGELTYILFDNTKSNTNETKVRELFTYKSTDPLVNRSQSFGTMFEYVSSGNTEGATNKLVSRKYITWDPRGRAATTKYEYKVIPPPPRKLVKWKDGDMEFTEYEDVLETKEAMEKLKMLAERRRREELGNVNNNAVPGYNSEGGRRKTRKQRRSTQ